MSKDKGTDVDEVLGSMEAPVELEAPRRKKIKK